LKYPFFHHTLESNIQLPELPGETDGSPTIFFRSTTITETTKSVSTWHHHWRLPNGQISISLRKEKDRYWLRFPSIARFLITPGNNHVICFRHSGVPDTTIRHLLLDQVVPRLLSHNGEQIIHASCIKNGASTIAFSGESGFGKSTLAAYFHSQGFPLLTDDCLLLTTTGSTIYGTPNYPGVRLAKDALALISKTILSAAPVTHYGTKKRVVLHNSCDMTPRPLAALFILQPPGNNSAPTISIDKISGAQAALELIKNSFPLDISDSPVMGEQLKKLAFIAGSAELNIYHLSYPRRIKVLPEVIKNVLGTLNNAKQEDR